MSAVRTVRLQAAVGGDPKAAGRLDTITTMPSIRRIAPIAAAGIAAVLGLSGCGGGGAAAVDLWLGSDVVVTRAVTTTTTVPPADPAGGAASSTERTAQSQQYTVRHGDSVSRIASICGVEIDALVGINEWGSATAAELSPNQVIQVPPNGFVGCGGGTGAGTSGTEDGGTPALGKCADGSDAEVYKIVSGDNPSRVARAHDITLDELKAANQGNSAMTKFNVGQELYLPC